MCGVGVGGVRGKNCHTLSGCSSSKGQDRSVQEAWSQLAGLLASASLLVRDSENFLFLLLNYLVKVIIFSVRSILCFYSVRLVNFKNLDSKINLKSTLNSQGFNTPHSALT